MPHRRNSSIKLKDKMPHRRNSSIKLKDKMPHRRNSSIKLKDKMPHRRNSSIKLNKQNTTLSEHFNKTKRQNRRRSEHFTIKTFPHSTLLSTPKTCMCHTGHVHSSTPPSPLIKNQQNKQTNKQKPTNKKQNPLILAGPIMHFYIHQHKVDLGFNVIQL
jgi:hypothetical protein